MQRVWAGPGVAREMQVDGVDNDDRVTFYFRAHAASPGMYRSRQCIHERR